VNEVSMVAIFVLQYKSISVYNLFNLLFP